MIQIKKNNELFKLHKRVIKDKLISEIDKILLKKSIKINKKTVRIYKKQIELLQYIRTNTDNFITSDIKEQKILIELMKKNYDVVLPNYRKDDKRLNSYKIVRYLFEQRTYDEFSKNIEYRTKDGKNEIYGAYKFVELLNLRTCPYCNRNYISVIEKNDLNDKQTRPELDHFHPKSIYPFLAINYYNLIPSCSTCNKLKSDDNSLKLLHPYDDDINKINITYWLNDMKFYNVKSIKDLTFGSEKSIEIEIENMPNSNKKVFQLERLYQEHTDIVIELILRHLHYPQSYIEELSSFGYNKEEIYRFIFSNYLNEENLSKRPLSKLTKDIAEELNLLSY